MSLRSIPAMIFPFLLYNVLVFLLGTDVPAADVLGRVIFTMPMVSGAQWSFTIGDLVILVTLIVLFMEIVKATYTGTPSLVDHGLSMLVFIACGLEFLLWSKAGTSVFFLLTTATLIDVIAGYTIGIRVARRDIGFAPGGGE